MFVEILDRRGRVRERYKASQFPVTVGRAYDNDVIIDDSYVCPHHLVIEHDDSDGIVVKDRGSVNGVFQLAPLRRVQQLRLDSELRLRIGHTVLRLRSGDFAVVPADIDRFNPTWVGELSDSRLATLLLMILTGVVLTADEYFNWYDEVSVSRALAATMPVWVAVLTWSGVWALVSRTVNHRSYWHTHMNIAMAGTIAATVLAVVHEYAAFAFSWHRVAMAVQQIGFAVLFAVVIFSHLRYCSLRPPRILAIEASLVAVIVVSVSVFNEYVKEADFSADLDYPGVLKPLEYKAVDSVALDELLAAGRALRDRVDREVTERRVGP